MFKDTEKELKRLEQELLETDTDELLAQLHQELDQEVPVYNTDKVDTDVEELSRQVQEPYAENLKGLVVAAVLLTLGIVVLTGWWLVRLLG